MQQFALRATDVYITLMITLFPLLTGPDGYNWIGSIKLGAFCVLTLLWLQCLCVSMFVAAARGRMPKPGFVEWMCLAFMAASTVSAVCSDNAVFCSTTSGGLLEYLLYGGALIGIFRFGKLKKRYLYLAAGSYCLCCVITALQLMGFDPLGLYPANLNYHHPVAAELCPFLGTIGNIDTLSAYHCLMIPLLIAAVVYGKGKWRFALLLPALLGAVCAVVTAVASGLLAFCCAAAVFACVAAAKWYVRRRKNAPSVWCVTLLLMALLLTAVLTAVYFAPLTSGTLYELKMVLHGQIEDHFGSSRIRIWRAAVREFFEHPLIGVGPDCLYFHLDIRFERYSEVLQELRVTYAGNAHNEYLELLCTVGVLGFLPFAALMGATWVRALRSGEESVKLLIPAMLCYLMQAFFNIGSHVITPVFIILWGLLLSRIWKKRSCEE